MLKSLTTFVLVLMFIVLQGCYSDAPVVVENITNAVFTHSVSVAKAEGAVAADAYIDSMAEQGKITEIQAELLKLHWREVINKGITEGTEIKPVE